MNERTDKCPYCGNDFRKPRCPHNLIGFTTVYNPKLVRDEDIENRIVAWLESTNSHDFDDFLEEAGNVEIGQWGGCPYIGDKRDNLYYLKEFMEFYAIKEVVDVIIEYLSKIYTVSKCRYGYFVLDNGNVVPIRKLQNQIASLNGFVKLELRYMISECQEALLEANKYLGIYLSFRKLTPITHTMVLSQISKKFRNILEKQSDVEIRISREWLIHALCVMGEKLPLDHHRTEPPKPFRIQGLPPWKVEPDEYIKGLRFFLSLAHATDDTAKKIHSNLLKLYEFLSDENNQATDIVLYKEKGITLRDLSKAIRRLLFKKYGFNDYTPNKEWQILKQLTENNKISSDLGASISYLRCIANGLIHAGDEDPKESGFFNIHYLHDVLQAGFDFIFGKILPSLS